MLAIVGHVGQQLGVETSPKTRAAAAGTGAKGCPVVNNRAAPIPAPSNNHRNVGSGPAADAISSGLEIGVVLKHGRRDRVVTAQPLAKWSSSAPSQAMPSTAMARAFLVAICEWAARESHTRRVTLPTGNVDADELRKVVVALTCARGAKSGAKKGNGKWSTNEIQLPP